MTMTRNRTCNYSCHFFLAATFTVLLCGAAQPAVAQQAVRVHESFAPGALYHVSMRVQLNGALTLPAEKGETVGKKLVVKGSSSIDYDERILSVERDGTVKKSARSYERMEFDRKIGPQAQSGHLRAGVRRLVILRHKQTEVPFSPDGPLTWGEIDMVRTDVFTPALVGLFPDRAVRPGERWSATTAVLRELTDFDKIDHGNVVCKLEGITALGGRDHARVSFSGTVLGDGEDGRGRQQLEGYYYFDLVANRLTYLSMRGGHSMLDMDGKEVGKIEGNFVLTRQPLDKAPLLSAAALRKVALEPDAKNTRLLYDNTELGIRFLYPRRWRVAGMQGRQLGLDERGGSGIMLTVESPKTTPTGQQFLRESQQWLNKQKAVILRTEPVKVVQRYPHQIEQFGMDVRAGKEQFRMFYLIVHQAEGGVVLAGRLLKKDLANLQSEVREIAESIRIEKRR